MWYMVVVRCTCVLLYNQYETDRGGLKEHIEDFHKSGDKNWKTFEHNYSRALQTLRDESPIVAQTFRNGKNQVTTIRPTWLCIQCPFVFSEELRKSHWISPSKHSFCEQSLFEHERILLTSLESR